MYFIFCEIQFRFSYYIVNKYIFIWIHIHSIRYTQNRLNIYSIIPIYCVYTENCIPIFKISIQWKKYQQIKFIDSIKKTWYYTYDDFSVTKIKYIMYICIMFRNIAFLILALLTQLYVRIDKLLKYGQHLYDRII